jgi:hypothetical protein
MTYRYRGIQVTVSKFKYSDGKVALTMIDKKEGIGIMKITINMDGINKNEVAIKNYSENEGIYVWLLQNQIVKPAHRYTRLNYVAVPVCYLNEDFLNQN